MTFAPRRAVLAAALLAAFLPGHGHAAPAPDVSGIPIRMEEREMRAAGITLARVEAEQGVTEIAFPGLAVVPPQQLRIIAAPAAGLVETMLVAADEWVEAGQPLARLRSTELVEAQRAFLEAMTRDGLARNKLWRDEQLFRERVISERRLIVTRAEAQAAAALLAERRQMLDLFGMAEADKRALAERREIRPALTVVAPALGVVLERQAMPGERVPQTAPLFTVGQTDPLWVNLQVPLAAVAMLEPGARVALPAQGLEGRVLRVGQSADPATQSVLAVAEVRGPNGRLRPGQAISATVSVATNGAPQWRVPAGSVVRHRERQWVFLRTPAGFEARPITLVTETAQSVSIRGDLPPGAQVAMRGVLPLIAALAAGDQD